ncbi:hypothetical protein [Streptomyces sp. SD11]|uniref:hypothetical protein n=1 Tax=Streptomyces sp. SD11 TaxID=3452209 RepID=UPI003F886EDC
MAARATGRARALAELGGRCDEVAVAEIDGARAALPARAGAAAILEFAARPHGCTAARRDGTAPVIAALPVRHGSPRASRDTPHVTGHPARHGAPRASRGTPRVTGHPVHDRAPRA